MKEGSSCLFSEGNPLGYESVCRQKFILRKLVALNGEGKTALVSNSMELYFYKHKNSNEIKYKPIILI